MDYQLKTREELISDLLKLQEENTALNLSLKEFSKMKAESEGQNVISDCKKLEHDLNERIKELTCHNQISAIMADHRLSVDEAILKIVEIIPSAWQYPKYAMVSITINGRIYKTHGFKKTPYCQTQDIVNKNEIIGQIQLCYDATVSYAEPVFLPEEANLIFTIAVRIAGLVENNERMLQLSNTEHKYQSLVEHINDVIYEVDEAGIVKYISPAIYKLIGYTPEEIIGKCFLDFVGDNREILGTRLLELKTQNTSDNEYKVHSRNGELRWIRLSSKGIFENGEFRGGSGTMVNVTEKKLIELELQKSESLYKSILNSSPDNITLTDLEGNIILSSPNGATMFGYDADFKGQSIAKFIHESERERVFSALKSRIDNKSGSVYNEFKAIKWDGTIFFVEVKWDVIRNSDNEPVNLIFILRDITSRKEIEEKLSSSEEKYRQMVERINDVIFEVTGDGLIKYVSPAIEKVLGYTAEELTGKNFFSYMYPADIPYLSSALANLVNRDSSDLEYRYIKKDGTVRWVRSSTKPTFVDGKMVGGIGVLIDIHERKLAEENLRQSELRYKSFFEGNTSIMLLVDPESGEIKDANPAASQYYGWSKEEICRMNIAEINMLTPEEIAAEMQQAKMEERKHFFFKHRLANGEIHDVEVYSGPIEFDGTTLLYSIVHDITERKIAENKLILSEEKYRNIFETVQDAYYEASTEGIIIDISPAIEIISRGQFTRDGLIGTSLVQFYEHPEDRDKFYAELMKTGRVNDYELSFFNRDGSIIPLAITSTLVRDDNGYPTKITGSMRDITERKKAETELKISEEKYRLLFSNNPQPMWISDLETLAFLEVNQAAIDQYGYTREEFLQMTIKDIRPVEDVAELLEDVEKTAKNNNTKGIWRHVWKNGELRNVEVSGNTIHFNGRNACHILVNDITERIQAETALRESETKFRSIAEQTSDLIGIVDENGIIVYVSPSSQSMFGRSPEEFTGFHFSVFNPAENIPKANAVFQSILEQNISIKDEVFVLKHADGTDLFLEVNASKFDSDSQKGILVTVHDITERKKVDDALRLSNQKWEAIIAASPYGIGTVGLDGKLQLISDQLATMYGYSVDDKDELIGTSVFNFADPFDHPRLLENIQKSLQGDLVLGVTEYLAIKKDGSRFHVELNSTVLYDNNGQPESILYIQRDITERKLAEENVLKLNRLKSVVSNVNLAIIEEKSKESLLQRVCSIAIKAGEFQMAWVGKVDSESQKVIPVNVDGFENGYLTDIRQITVTDSPEGNGPTGRCLKGGKPVICNDINSDPVMAPWRDEALKRNYRSSISLLLKQFGENYGALTLYSSVPDFFSSEETELLVGVVDNINNALEAIESEENRKKAEAELRKLSRAVEQSPVSIVITNIDGNIEYANPKACETTGYSLEELFGQNPRVLQSGETAKDEYVSLWTKISSGNEWHGLFHNKKKTGELYWESSTIAPVLDDQGVITHYVAIKEDITEQRKAEEEIRKFRTISDTANYGTVIGSLKGDLLYVNEAFATILGYEKTDLIGRNLKEFYSEERFLMVTKLMNKVFENGGFVAEEVWHKRKDGTLIPTLMNGTLIKNEKGEPIYMSASAIDITSIKASEEALVRNEANLNYAQEIANMGSWELDMVSGETKWSANYYRIMGLSPFQKDIPEDYFNQIVHPDDRHLLDEKLKTVLKTMQPGGALIRLVLPNAKTKWIKNNFVPVFEKDKLVALRGVNIDITELKVAEDKLIEQNERLNAIMSAMPDMIFLRDKDGKFIESFAGDKAKHSSLISEPMVGTDFNEVFDKETTDLHHKNIKKCVEEQKLVTYEYPLTIANSKHHFEARVVPMGADKVLSFVRDITKRKNNEREIKKLSLVIEQSPILIVITDLNGIIEYVNPVFTEITGYTAEEVVGKSTRVLKSGKTDKAVYTDLWDTIATGKEWHSEWINKKKNGELYWESVSITPLTDESGKLLNYVAIKQDISERKKAEQEIHELNETLELRIQQRTEQLAETNNDLLRVIEERKQLDEALIASEQSYQTVVENVKEIIFQTDNDGLWVFLNKAWEEITGFTVEESIGELFVNYVHPDDRQRNWDLFAPLINREKEYCRHQIRYLTKDGGFRWIEVYARLGLNEKDEIMGTYGTLQDITERKWAEEFENEMLQLSPQLTGITVSQIDSALNLALSRIGNFLSADRAYVFEIDGDETMSNTYEWCNDGVTPEIDNLQSIPCDMLPRWMEELNHHRNIIIPSIVDLPESWQAEREILEPQGIQSLIVIPMLIEDVLIGFVGLDSVKIKKDYTTAEINILKVWSSMLASLINNKRTEALLEQTRQNYETFFNTIDDFLWVLDEQGNIIHMNDTVKNRLEYPVDELYNSSVLMVHPVERREEAGRIVGEMLSGTAEFCPVPVVTKSGIQIPVETRVKRGFWNGDPVLFGVSKDISQVQLSEQKFSAAFQSSSALMEISYFKDGKYVDVNNALIQTLGYSREEIIGKTHNELNFFADKNIYTEILEKLNSNVLVRELEVLKCLKDGSLRTFLLSADVIYLGSERSLLTVAVDITDRKNAEEEIRKARLEAETANVAKSEFLSRMSHELRTPMNSILGFAQLLEMGELNPGQKKGVNHIMRSGKHLLSLINEVLDISRIEAGRLSISIEPIKVNGLLVEMLDVIRPAAANRHINLDQTALGDNQLFVMSDRQSLKQIILNLLNNAIKYNKTGGSVFVRTQTVQKDNSETLYVRISITDTGFGISADDIPKLFTPFERIGADKTGIEGTGLGLAVVKKLVEAMGGYLGVESMPGEGSTFWVEMPKAESQLEHLLKSNELLDVSSDSSEKQGTVLYIEDNVSNIELVEQILTFKRPGIQLINNMNGKKAVSLAIEYKPDLILLDLNLPDINGNEVLGLLLGNEKTKDIPVVVISADAMHKQVEKLIKAGAKKYLTKPIEVVAFLDVIDEFVR